MSFGYSVGDAILLTGLAWKTYRNSREACGEYDELTQEVKVCHVVLCRLKRELGKPDSPLFQEEDFQELETITKGCEKVLRILDQILVKYNALSEDERRGKRLWQKIRFGNGKVEEVREQRARLTYYTQALSLYLNLHTAGSVGRIEKQMKEGSSDLKDIRVAVNNGFAQLLANNFHHQEGSILTTYPEDEKGVWRELRRELIKDNVRSSLVKKHKHLIMAYIKELGARGLLDDEDTQSPPRAVNDPDTAKKDFWSSPFRKEPPQRLGTYQPISNPEFTPARRSDTAHMERARNEPSKPTCLGDTANRSDIVSSDSGSETPEEIIKPVRPRLLHRDTMDPASPVPRLSSSDSDPCDSGSLSPEEIVIPPRPGRRSETAPYVLREPKNSVAERVEKYRPRRGQ